MKGFINIFGEIGGKKGITLKDVVSQVQQQKEAVEYDVIINSPGGSVTEGFAIYDYLKSLNKPLRTIGTGIVASIATIPFAAGQTRILKPGAKFMIHLPSGGVDGTAAYIEEYAKALKAAQTKIADFYKTNLGLTDEAIYPMLESETWLSPEEAKNIGFSTAAEAEIVAHFKIDNNMNLNNEDKNWLEGMLNKLLGKKGDFKNMTLTTADGKIVDFAKVEEGAQPSIGDEATIDGEIPDGEILMSTNETFVFEKGVLTEIKAAETDAEGDDNSTKELEDLKAENEALKAEIESLKEQLKAKETDAENMVKEIKNFKRQITSRFTPEKETGDKNKSDKGEPTQNRKLFKD